VALNPKLLHISARTAIYSICDLLDLYEGFKQLSMEPDRLIACFEHYLVLEGRPISRAFAEAGLEQW